MRTDRFQRRLKVQRLAIAAVAMFTLAAFLAIPGLAFAKTVSYTFVFEHTDGTTTEISGTTEDKELFLSTAGGDSKDSPTGMTL